MKETPLADVIERFQLQSMAQVLEEVQQPCIKGFVGEAPLKIGGSKIGGRPDVTDEFRWPLREDKPLAFIAQINLAEFKHDLLPPAGMLYFFYDLEVWGFDPDDSASVRVIYEEPGGAHNPIRLPTFETKVLFGLKTKLVKPTTFGECRISFYPGYSLPSADDKRLEEFLKDDQLSDRYCDAKEASTPIVQLFGHPNPIQQDIMQLECQLVTNGLYCGDTSGYENPRALELAKGKDDWVLLFQLGEHPPSEMTWGDAGMLYFWIRKQDLAERRFERTWMILQCC